MATAMEDLKEFNRVFIVTDSYSYQRTPSFVQELIGMLRSRSHHLDYHANFEAEDATESTIKKGSDAIKNFDPGT